MVKNIKTKLRLSSPSKFRGGFRHYPICEAVKPIIRLSDNEIAIRCILNLLESVGFESDRVVTVDLPDHWGIATGAVIAQK